MTNQEKKPIPRHVGIIMDGNRRWARERNLPTLEGHLRGHAKLKQIGDWFFSRGVEFISVFAFSTENWNRSREEVNYLMKLLKKALGEELEEFHNRGFRLLISGRLHELPGDLPDLCAAAMVKTANNVKGTLNICLNYGGRAEIIDAIGKIVAKEIGVDQVHEGMLKKYFYQGQLPDPDMIVRTSGEKRLSGFLLWQSAYAELHFLEKYWPDFERADADQILEEYARRKRRFGGD